MRWKGPLSAALLLLLLCGCATYAAVVEAPPAFWISLEAIVSGLVEDIISIIGWLL